MTLVVQDEGGTIVLAQRNQRVLVQVLPGVRLRLLARNEFRDRVEDDEAGECLSAKASMNFPPDLVSSAGRSGMW